MVTKRCYTFRYRPSGLEKAQLQKGFPGSLMRLPCRIEHQEHHPPGHADALSHLPSDVCVRRCKADGITSIVLCVN